MADRRVGTITVSSRTIDLAGEIIVIPQIVRLREMEFEIRRGLAGRRTRPPGPRDRPPALRPDAGLGVERPHRRNPRPAGAPDPPGRGALHVPATQALHPGHRPCEWQPQRPLGE